MKKKVLVLINGRDGCKLHRLILPYDKIYHSEGKEFDLEFLFYTGQTDEQLLEQALQCDVFIYHRFIVEKMFNAMKAKGITMISDQDDNWVLNSTHPLYSKFRNELSNRIAEQIKQCDYVTVTTDVIATKVKALNKNVAVFPNALVSEGQFEPHINRSKYIRVGWMGGSSHVADIRMLQGFVNQLPQDVRDSVQFVLCGFDGGKRNIIYPDGHVQTVPMKYEETCWGEFERIFTDNYSVVSEGFKNHLLKFVPQDDRDYGEHYRRVWTKPFTSYAEGYDKMDICLIPLRKDFFNEAKSPLKLIECAVKNVAVIVSDVEPYSKLLKPVITKGGDIDPEGNCIAIGDNKGVKSWVKAITKLVRSEELRNTITTNLHKLVEENADYNLHKVAKDRLKWLNEICART